MQRRGFLGAVLGSVAAVPAIPQNPAKPKITQQLMPYCCEMPMMLIRDYERKTSAWKCSKQGCAHNAKPVFIPDMVLADS